jgi:hypothetical protein
VSIYTSIPRGYVFILLQGSAKKSPLDEFLLRPNLAIMASTSSSLCCDRMLTLSISLPRAVSLKKKECDS